MAIAQLTNALKLSRMNGSMDLHSQRYGIQLLKNGITETGSTIQFTPVLFTDIAAGDKVGVSKDLVGVVSQSVSWEIEGDGSGIVYAKTKTGAGSPFDFSGATDMLAIGFVVYNKSTNQIVLVASFGSTKAVGVITFTDNKVFGLQ